MAAAIAGRTLQPAWPLASESSGGCTEEPLKALVLAGGRGSRLRSLTRSTNKCLLKFDGRHLIQFSFETALSLGVESIGVVIGYRGSDIRAACGSDYHGIPISYIVQRRTIGVVNAMECAIDFIGASDFILLLADEVLFDPRHMAMQDRFKSLDLFVSCGIVHVDDTNLTRKTYSVLGVGSSEAGKILRLEEKPENPLNDMMGTGNCLMKSDIFRYLDRTPVNPLRGQKELPALIQCAIDDGQRVEYFDVGSAYMNVNSMDDILPATSLSAAR